MATLRCPFCAHERLRVVSDTRSAAVLCPECGATGPTASAGDRGHAVFLWNQRFGSDLFAAAAELELSEPPLH